MLKKRHCFFFAELQLITVLFFSHESYMTLIVCLVSSKVCEGFSIFGSVFFLLKSKFLVTKKHALCYFETS